MRALVYGLAVAGASTARALLRRDVEVIVGDDTITPERMELARDMGVDLLDSPDEAALRGILAGCDLLCPAPGVPETHRVIAAARATGTEIVSEIELAYRWEQQRDGGPRPMLGVTGTDGKTTTTLMTVEMLRAAGLSTIDAGNTDTPLVDAIDDDHDAFVVECTSFRLAWTRDFRCAAAVWLNLAPDHLNWHESMDSYSAAKARIWAAQRADDAAIAFTASSAVMGKLDDAPGRHLTFGPGGVYRLEHDRLVGPAGEIAATGSMRRSLPHDITNALAASALVLETGLADTDAIQRALADFSGPAHRLERLGAHGGVEWYNDSKATTPHAAAVAIHAFDRIVLIAGGKDKHVDLAEMAVEPERLKAVIAIGETRDSVAAAFAGVPTVVTTEFLPDAVERAAGLAQPGDTVLLSPGCASLDQYRSFEARGDHFRELAPTRGDT
ncbi:UDP-N-acetylmuramoyl-L-alanine--D-glutamate ligase [Ilumatobacter sp.]|uniref:UDP-N-acetylmuramoyl-L-alanine--D-glutamate ligase n=1 Tax=Ilumatobacter sp. TaxID=1967498 RepID=UPI003C53925B